MPIGSPAQRLCVSSRELDTASCVGSTSSSWKSTDLLPGLDSAMTQLYELVAAMSLRSVIFD